MHLRLLVQPLPLPLSLLLLLVPPTSLSAPEKMSCLPARGGAAAYLTECPREDELHASQGWPLEVEVGVVKDDDVTVQEQHVQAQAHLMSRAG